MKHFFKTSMRSFGVGLLALGCVSVQAQTAPPGNLQRAGQLNDLGVAYLNEQLGDRAIELFRQAAATDHQLAVPVLNTGIAQLALGNRSEARVELEKAARMDPRDPRVWYNLGLLERADNDVPAMERDFERVIALDPRNADAHYFLGLSFSEAGNLSKAVPQFRSALALDPVHASSEFALARALQRTGDAAAAKQHLQHFQHMTQARVATTLAQTYGDQGLYSVAEELRSGPMTAGPMIPIRLTPETVAAAGSAKASGSAAMCVLDRLGEGQSDLVVLGAGPQALRVFRASGSGLRSEDAAALGIAVSGAAVGCTGADFDNDGHQDLLIALRDRIVLLRNRGDGTFTDVTKASSIGAVHDATGVLAVDFDHDGALDFYVTSAATHGNTLWRNMGNGTFAAWTEPTGLAGQAGTRAAALSDVDNDHAVDVLTAGADGVTAYHNPREGTFAPRPVYRGHGVDALAVFDFNKDERMDFVLALPAAPGVVLLRNVDGLRFEPVPLPLPGVLRAWSVAPIDIDNDGWLDLAALVETKNGTELRVLRNTGASRFTDVTAQLRVPARAATHARTVMALDARGDGAAGLLLAAADGSVTFLRNLGGNRNHAVQLTAQGLADNKSGVGSKVEVFNGQTWQKWEINGAGGNSILAGLGSATKPLIVRFFWPTGVPQDEIDPGPGPRLVIPETDRRGSSCPVLFAWNGEKYEFISDMIGAGVVGHWVGPNTRNKPRPEEWLAVPGTALQAHNGLLSLRFGEPMEEVNYIDRMRLIAIDHPADTVVLPNERFGITAPTPEAQLVFARQPHPVLAAWDSTGRDVTATLRDADHKFVEGFDLLPSYKGFTSMHTLTLDLGPWTTANPLRLLMTGYLFSFTDTTLYEAHQAGLLPVSPYVEAELPDGSWKRVLDNMGYPAGLYKTMVADLTGLLPPGTRRIRITTNRQIYWDQVLVANDAAPAGNEMRATEVPLRHATLAQNGYPKQVELGTPGDLTFDYSYRSVTAPFVPERGMYTHFGDVTPLLQTVDDQFVVFGTGEDVDAEFDAAVLPALPPGSVRDYAFYIHGYDKDMDLYEASPFSVEQLPFAAMRHYPYSPGEHFPDTPESLRYQLLWNDRAVNGGTHIWFAPKYEFAPAVPGVP